MNLGLDCPCLINVGGRGVSGTDWLISPVYSSPKEDSRWVRANLNQESSYLDVALFSLQNQGLLGRGVRNRRRENLSIAKKGGGPDLYQDFLVDL